MLQLMPAIHLMHTTVYNGSYGMGPEMMDGRKDGSLATPSSSLTRIPITGIAELDPAYSITAG